MSTKDALLVRTDAACDAERSGAVYTSEVSKWKTMDCSAVEVLGEGLRTRFDMEGKEEPFVLSMVHEEEYGLSNPSRVTRRC